MKEKLTLTDFIALSLIFPVLFIILLFGDVLILFVPLAIIFFLAKAAKKAISS